jgi:dTDP-glucose 4,6-dehydratase
LKILITGAAGFIGHHLVEAVLRRTDWDITVIDRLDVSGNLNRLAEIGAAKNPRVRFQFHDLRAPFNDQLCLQIGTHDYIVHMAAATHVDRSISDPMAFILDNVVATGNMLDLARMIGCRKFFNFSTDEVFGPAPPGVQYREDDRYNAGNPYAATKAGAAQLGVSYFNTYRLPVITTHTMNVIGARQHPEKFLPSTVSKVMAGEVVTIHANRDRTKAGSRFYINAQDVADAMLFLVEHGVPGEKYNIVGERETDNKEFAAMIAEACGQPLRCALVDHHSSRPGHDLRYALDGTKMAAMGWRPTPIAQTVQEIVEWTLANPKWLQV